MPPGQRRERRKQMMKKRARKYEPEALCQLMEAKDLKLEGITLRNFPSALRKAEGTSTSRKAKTSCPVGEKDRSC